MLIEIPDPEVILGVVFAFLGGLLALYIFYKIRPSLNKKESTDYSYLERLSFYEKQLIDMKIRLDSLDISNETRKSSYSYNNIHDDENYMSIEEKPRLRKRPTMQANKSTQPDYHNMVDYVLGLITDKPMTSRDIQTASQRSREHTSRLMNKLYKEGYVQRNTKTKPYSYSITDKGLGRLGAKKNLPEMVA
jgi:predicted transcriptional regulator